MLPLVVIVHYLIVTVPILTSVALLWWPAALSLHLCLASFYIITLVTPWRCPLTALEDALRRRRGLEAYQHQFMDQYVYRYLGRHGKSLWISTNAAVILGMYTLVGSGVRWVEAWSVIRTLYRPMAH